MDIRVSVQLILMLAINGIAFICGMILNSLVVFCWLKSSQLQKKVCHFTICLLSCVDLLAVAINSPVLITELIFWIGEKESIFKLRTVTHFFDVFLAFSLNTLLLVSFERYLAVFHPIFHHTKVTKSLLIKLHFVFLFISTMMFLIHITEHFLASTILFCLLFMFPFIYVNTKLHIISKKYRRKNVTTSESHSQLSKKGKSFIKSISTCLLLVACVSICFMPTIISYIVWALKKHRLGSQLYMAKTFWCINSTTNCLLIFWRNKNLRSEARKILKQLSNTSSSF
ncbi:G-protein coupled receptor 39-like [Xenia sp. Carnegie-2017]|uniref:G-protein coupled receptor 39-like n=1 Tax=Xenia sp. Carnegie-2017 TaxID=2897299 RepID=UPI001F035800|nr:G-protein coupled receptor 39-like [Xenia sp. Carnegie-2017]